MSEITKDQLDAYTESASKTVVSLEKIASSLEDLVTGQTDCKNKIDALALVAHDNQVTLTGMNTRQKNIVVNVVWVKWLWTILAGIVALGIIILELMHKVVGG